MQRNLYTDDLERLIRQKADQYKMYPSDQVWKGVYKSLHGRKRWRWAGLVIFLLGIGIYTGNYYIADKPAGKLAKNLQTSISAANQGFPQASASAPAASNSATTPFVRNGTQRAGNDTRNTAGSTNRDQRNNTTPDNYSSVFAFSDEGLVISNDPQREENGTAGKTSNIQGETGVAAQKDISTEAKETEDKKTETAANTRPEKAAALFADAASESVLKENKSQSVNWLQDYAVFQLTPPKVQRIGLQISFSPTVNYRKLSGSSSFTTSELKSIPLSPNIVGDVDQYVKHKPALGFEMGAHLLYRSSKRVTLKGGLQFNYSRYDIEAYSTLPEIATIALNNNQAFIADTISTYSSIRNLSGFEQENLANQYFQLSMPIGVEFRLLGTDKLQLNVAGTIQPTYLLNRNSYLITTDYRNYMREPSLVRRWNINGGFETYISYNTGTVRWQVGPQFRYQLLSTYVRKYPIKEQLMEYGIKVGVSKTIR